MTAPPPVLTCWDDYVFPEESLPGGTPLLMLRDPLPRASRDGLPTFQTIDPEGNHTVTEVIKLLSGPAPKVASLTYHGAHTKRNQVVWVKFSPYEVYLERVFAEKLCEVE